MNTSLITLGLCVLFTIGQVLCTMALWNQEYFPEGRKEKRTLRLSASFLSFFSILFAGSFLRWTFPNAFGSTASLFFLYAVLWILNSILDRLVMVPAAKKNRPWLNAFADWMYRLFGWTSNWLPMPERPHQPDERFEKNKDEEGFSDSDEEDEEANVIENVLELNDKDLDEICTHRSEVVSLGLDQPEDEWRKIIQENRHTFYPVYNENEEDIIGILDTRDYFRLPSQDRQTVLKKTIDKPFFVAENTTADELLHQMKKRKTYFAIVLDEYGGMTGIVTLHDILEELLGDITEAEDAARVADIVKLPRGMWRISGSASLEDVSRALKEKLELDDFETFSGYILGTLGYIPEDGTQFETDIGDLQIQITSIKNHRIRQTVVRKKPQALPEPEVSGKEKAGRNGQSAAPEK